jgi:hypothetical protein
MATPVVRKAEPEMNGLATRFAKIWEVAPQLKLKSRIPVSKPLMFVANTIIGKFNESWFTPKALKAWIKLQ